jgi:hypothetical protein
MPGSSKWPLYLRFPHQNPVYNSPISHTCYICHPSHSSKLMPRIIFVEDYGPLSSSLWSFIHSHFTSSLLGRNILLSTLFSNTLSLLYSLKCERPCFTPIQNNWQYCTSVYLFVCGLSAWRKKYLHRKKVSIPWLQSAFIFILNRILTR